MAAPVIVDYPDTRTVSPRTAVVVFRLAALFTLLAAVMGAMVSATASGAACPTWPGCFSDSVAPPAAIHPVIEFTHRAVAIVAGPLMLAAGVLAGRVARPTRTVRLLPWVALTCAGVAAAVGRLVVLSTVPAWLGAVDLFCALSAMVATTGAAVLAARPVPDPGTGARRGGRRTWPALALALLLVVHPLGIVVAGPGSRTGVIGWPDWETVPGDLHPAIQGLRIALALLAMGVIVTMPLVVGERRTLDSLPATLLAVELALGATLDRYPDSHVAVLVAHAVVAVLIVWALAVAGALQPRPSSIREW